MEAGRAMHEPEEDQPRRISGCKSAARSASSTSTIPKLPDWIDKQRADLRRLSLRQENATATSMTRRWRSCRSNWSRLQAWLQATGKRVMAMFEGRDAAGKGGTIYAMRQYMNPRTARNVALTKPTETERGPMVLSSAMSRSFRPPANSSPSTAPGTIAPASSRSWASARRSSTQHFLERDAALRED